MSPRTCNVMAYSHFVDTPLSVDQLKTPREVNTSILSLYKSCPITEAYLQLEMSCPKLFS